MFRWFGILSVALAARILAQDVVIAPLAWFDPHDAPQQLPVRNRKLKVEFPDDLRKTPDVGWAMLDVWLDGTGVARSQITRGTQPLYARALTMGDADGRGYKPASRDGVPVSTRVRVVATFNPASANPKAPNATARLLDASVIVDPNWKTDEKNWIELQRVVWAEVQLDEQGGVSGLKTAESDCEGLLKTSVSSWRFAPAKQDGRPVPGTLRVPFIILPRESDDGKKREMPKALSRPLPVYPLSMRRSGLRGDVLVEFVVNAEGRAENAVVVRTLNPAFNESALEAIRGFRFEPGRVDGRAVKTRMMQPISYSLDMFGGGSDGMEVTRRANLAKLPPELRYDTPPKIDATVPLRYPYELLRARKTGSAVVNLLIGPDGKVAFSRVMKADKPEFGLALQAAADLFEYLPALKNGQPTTALLAFEQNFRTTVDGPVTDADREALALETKHPEKILKASLLDHRLTPTVGSRPVFPKAESVAKIDKGNATVEFLVDEKGEVRLPRIVSASDPVFGYAAVQAVAMWRFEPPTSQGKPGVVRVQVPIDFVRPPAKEADAGESKR